MNDRWKNLNYIRRDISCDEGIGKWAGECPPGCEKVYAEWIYDDGLAHGYYYVDENAVRHGYFRSYYSGGEKMFECFYIDGKKQGLSYGYYSDGGYEKIYFYEEVINIEDHKKYLAIERLRGFESK
jgi:antitoxin component YwqK of YwqJK toxin-antitoxin module